MSDQTTANQPAEPVLCKMGCGFFGNNATGGCCSKCWRDLQKKEGVDTQPAVHSEPICRPTAEEPAPMEVDEIQETPETPQKEETPAPVEEVPSSEAPSSVAPSTEAPKKRKKKKASYKNMMAGMMKSSSPSRDIEKEKEGLRKVTGGGAFSKIEKI